MTWFWILLTAYALVYAVWPFGGEAFTRFADNFWQHVDDGIDWLLGRR